MKKVFAIGSFVTALVLLVSGCNKKLDPLPYYNDGSPVTLSSSKTTVAPLASDSLAKVLALSWTSPNYGIDPNSYKYIIEMDTAGRNFAKASRREVTGKLTDSISGRELNSILLSYGYAIGVPVDMDVRVISSYGNNNERLISNTVRIKMTPYKIPPKIALPASGRLFIVGDATTFGWSNDATPAFPAAREFSRIDETTWGGIFYLNGSGGYKLLQTQGVWDTQFHMVSGGTATAGSFVQENADPTFPSPATAGWYKIMIDFQNGRYSVTSFGNALPQELYITGDATVSGWSNAPPVAQKFTRLNSAEYEITTAFTPGKFYKFLSSSGNWQPQFGGNSATGGMLGANYGSGNDPESVPTPTTAGTYKVRVNFYTNTYKVAP